MSDPEITPLASPPLTEKWVPLWPTHSQYQLGDEMAYAQFTAPVNVVSAVDTTGNDIVDAPALTLDGATPVIVEFFAPNIAPGGGGTFYLMLQDGSTILLNRWAQMNVNGPIYARARLTPSAGTHTFRARGYILAANTIVNAGVGGSGAGVYSPGWIRVSRVNAVPPAVLPGPITPVTYGITLPAAPADGQEAILVDSLTAPTYSWRFLYVASITDAYKWVFVGGAPWVKHVAAAETTSTGSPVDLTTVQSFAVPRAGIYHARGSYGAFWSTTSGGAVAAGMSLYFGASIVDAKTSQQSMPLNGGAEFSGPLAAAAVIATKWMTSNVNANFRDRTLTVIPLRVA